MALGMSPSGPHSHKDVMCTQISVFQCLQASQKPWCSLAPQTSSPAWLNLQIWDATGGIRSCPAEPTVLVAHLPSLARSIPSNCFRSHLGKKGWTDSAQSQRGPSTGQVFFPKKGAGNGICWSFLTSRSAVGSGLSGCQLPAS